jgi:ubiquinone biosynthesis protein Coq4
MYKLLILIRSKILVWLTHSLALPILKLVRKPERFPYSLAELELFPDGSMGKALADFLEKKDLELLTYYARHDIKHILLGYDTTDEGEGCLQCFMLGNGHISFPVLATVIYCFVTMPEYWSKFRSAYQRGKESRSLEKVRWFEILPQPVSTLKTMVKPV